jgi:sRNA-binding regulator protein Hfq
MYLTNKDLCKIYRCCESTANNIKKEILNALKLNKKKVSIFNVADYEGITVENVKQIVGFV